jgi:hypothetical protein
MRTTMTDHRDAGPRSFRHLDLREKQEYLRVLCDVVRDIERELARARAERGALVRSMQADLQAQAVTDLR